MEIWVRCREMSRDSAVPQGTVVPATSPRPVWGGLPGRSCDLQSQDTTGSHHEPLAPGLRPSVPRGLSVCLLLTVKTASGSPANHQPMQQTAWIYTLDPSHLDPDQVG